MEEMAGRDLRTDPDFFELLVGSYYRLTGNLLIPNDLMGERGTEWLYGSAPFSVVAHDSAPDPVFIYANVAAQKLFGYEWDEFITLPSRLSAEARERGERERFLEVVKRDGFVKGYGGIRVTKSGRCFRIQNATVWQLTDQDGCFRGQAAMLPDISAA